MNHLLLTLLFATAACLNAQTPTQVMARLNDQLAAVPQGAFNVRS